MFEHVYAEMPATLLEQREELKRELAEFQETSQGDRPPRRHERQRPARGVTRAEN